MNFNSMKSDDNKVNTIYNAYKLESFVDKDIKLKKLAYSVHIEDGQVYCLENDIRDIEDLCRKDNYLYESFVLACSSYANQIISNFRYVDALDLDADKLVSLVTDIHESGNDNYQKDDLISYLKKQILQQTEWIAQRAIDQAWVNKDYFLIGRGE